MLKKLFSPRYGSYFIIRVNKHKNDLKFFDVLDFLRDKIPETAKITWTLCNKLKQMNKSRKSNNIDVELNPMAKDFFSSHLNSNSSFFNLCVSWNINGWNTEKRDSILYLNSIFKPICICLQETGKSKYLPKDVSSPLIPYYNSVYDQTEVLLIKPRFELHFMVFLIINLLFFLAIKFSPMAL